MQGLMQQTPLLIPSIIEFAAKFHGDTEIISRTLEGPVHRYGYREFLSRTKKLAKALGRLGVAPGEVLGTLAWNGFRHMEIYFAVPGMGAVCHTLNPRLFPPQIAYIANHAEDSYLFVDPTFVPLVEEIADQLQSVGGYIIMTDEAHMPETSLANALCYESLIAAEDDDYQWPDLDEETASSLCYTSGTTGNPKGVLYSHRSTMLHTFSTNLVDALGFSARDVVLPAVPMFHANAWGIPYAAPMAGATLVMPGKDMDGASLFELIDREGVTFTAGVPTVWLGLLQYLGETGKRLDSLETILIGGSAAPRSMIEAFEKDYGVTVKHAWGMTEMSPLGSVGTLKRKMLDLPQDERFDIQAKQGRGVFDVNLKIVDADGNELPWDGESMGRLMVRGASVARAYFKGEGAESFGADGWFDTGDVMTIDSDGYVQITDRAKDVIKSGGEWISSIELENIAVGHPGVAEAAVIGVAHPKWDERPLLVVVPAPGSNVTTEELLAHYQGKVAKWCIPDDVAFVDELPHAATGKLLKSKLREDFKDYKLPTAAE